MTARNPTIGAFPEAPQAAADKLLGLLLDVAKRQATATRTYANAFLAAEDSAQEPRRERAKLAASADQHELDNARARLDAYQLLVRLESWERNGD